MMKYCLAIVVSTLMTFLSIPFSDLRAAPGETGISNISEIILPEFQAAAIAKEGAVKDTLITGDILWLITNKILWKWTYLDRKVQKITLLQKSDADNLISLGTDGLNLYVAFTTGVYQFAIKQGKVYKYPFSGSPAVKKANFYGYGDSFWLIANDQISRIDRYGKTIIPGAKLPVTAPDAPTGFDPENSLYWYAVKNALYKMRIDGESKPEKILQLKQDIKTIVAKNEGALITTGQTVLITDSSGKRVQTIPVEKSRKIITASNGGNFHAYVFNDQILETFDLSSQEIGRYLLPLDGSSKISGLKVGSGLVHLISDGKAHLFAFPPKSNSSK